VDTVFIARKRTGFVPEKNKIQGNDDQKRNSLKSKCSDSCFRKFDSTERLRRDRVVPENEKKSDTVDKSDFSLGSVRAYGQEYKESVVTRLRDGALERSDNCQFFKDSM